MFDRIDNVYPDEPLVPFYPATKRAGMSDIPPERTPTSYGGRAPPPTAAVPGHADPRGHRAPPYSRAPVPRAYAVPHDTVATAAVVGGGRGDPMRVPSSESYSRAAPGPVDARGYQRPMTQPHPGVWESSTVTAGGGVVRSRRLPPGSGPGPSADPYPAGPGSATPPAVMYRERGRDRGYEVAGEGGPWPQQHQQQARRWRADGGVPSPTADAPPASRRRVSEWGDGRRGGGWS